MYQLVDIVACHIIRCPDILSIQIRDVYYTSITHTIILYRKCMKYTHRR